MVDIQSATADNRRGKKIERRKKKTKGRKYNGQGGHNKLQVFRFHEIGKYIVIWVAAARASVILALTTCYSNKPL